MALDLLSLLCTFENSSIQNAIDDYAKDGGEELLPRCITFFNRIPTELLRIRNMNAMHLGKKFLAAIFSVIVYSNSFLEQLKGLLTESAEVCFTHSKSRDHTLGKFQYYISFSIH